MAHTHFHHPGILLRDLYLEESGITQAQLAKGIGLPESRVSELCNGKRDITADLALRLGKFFGIDPRCFTNAQTHYDLEEAKAAQKAAHVVIRPFKP
ncbi:MAG: HigA family addiction module antidote protein, partial [Opitutaceae bacterium]|nr:HigA family addiction module antidote protein [Opitutaceae bacterium]